MAKDNQATLRIEWIRSGIAFNRSQKEIVRSLGLRRLHQVVECPDNPVVRGLVAKVSHLVEVREETKPSAWASIPEYTIIPPEAASQAASRAEETQTAAAGAAGDDATSQASGEPIAEPDTENQPSAPEQENETVEPTGI